MTTKPYDFNPLINYTRLLGQQFLRAPNINLHPYGDSMILNSKAMDDVAENLIIIAQYLGRLEEHLNRDGRPEDQPTLKLPH